MTILAGLVWGALLGGQGSSGSTPSSPTSELKVPSFELDNADIRVGIKRLFDTYKTPYTIGDDVRGKVNCHFKNLPFRVVLSEILSQVGATYRIVDFQKKHPTLMGTTSHEGVFLIRTNSRSPRQNPTNDDGTPIGSMIPNFVPGAYTSRYDFRNPALYTSPMRTKGGTLDLLLEAARIGEYRRWYVWTYGKDGFAVVLPFEYIRDDGTFARDGKSYQRFTYLAPYLFSFDFRKLGETVANESEWVPWHGRVIVLVASTEPIKPDGVGASQSIFRKDDPFDLPLAVRQQTWKGEVSLSALVYEFKSESGIDPVRLIPPGKSQLTVRDHLVGSKLWTVGLI